MPTIPQYASRGSPSARRQITRIDLSAGPELLGDIANDLQDVNLSFERKAQEEAAARAADADVEVSRKIREALYDTENGYLFSEKFDAVTRHEQIRSALSRIETEAYDGLDDGAQKRLRSVVGPRIEAAIQKTAVHQHRQRSAWLDASSDARIGAASNDALAGFAFGREVDQYIKIGIGEIRNKAARGGWSPEQRALAEQELTSSILKNVVMRRAQDDPASALVYARGNGHRMLASDMAYVEQTLEPEAKRQQGREWVAGRYASGPAMTGAYDAGIVMADGMQPDMAGVQPEVLDRFARLQGELGRKLPVNSGFRGSERNEQAGGAKNSQHLHGNALDIDVSGLSNKERAEVIATASALGFNGIGVYNNAIHIDLRSERKGWGPSHSKDSVPGWAKGAIQTHMRGGFAPAQTVKGEDIMSAALEINDPVMQEAALSEIAKRQSIQSAQERSQRQEAKDALWAFVDGGGDPANAPPSVRMAAGRETVIALENYYRKQIAGEPVRTDHEVYIELSRMSEASPSQFMAIDLMAYRDKLSDSDFKKMADSQADLAGGDKITEQPIAAILDPAERVFEMRGIVQGTAGSEQAQEFARLQTQVLRAVDQWQVENPGQTMPRGQIMQLAEVFAGNYRRPAAQQIGMTPSALRSAALAHVRAKIGTPAKKAEEIAEFERAHMQAARLFVARMGRDPSPAEASDIARDLLTELRVNPPGLQFFGDDKMFAYQITEEMLGWEITHEGRRLRITDSERAFQTFQSGESGGDPGFVLE